MPGTELRYTIVKGTENVTIDVFAEDAATPFQPVPGLAFGSAGIRAAWAKPQVADTDFTLITNTVTGAHSPRGFVEIDATSSPGWYRLDLEDVVVNIDSDWVKVHLGADGAFFWPIHIDLPTSTPNDNNILLASGVFGLAQMEIMLAGAQGAVSDASPLAGAFNTDLTQPDGFWDGRIVMFISGDLKGRTNRIRRSGGYVQVSGRMIFDVPWPFVPLDTDNFVVQATPDIQGPVAHGG